MSDQGVEYVFAQVVRWRDEICHGSFVPRTLREALPNRTYTLPGKTTFSYSDLAVIGRVTGAVKGPAYTHAAGEVLVPVDFDDPAAVEQCVDVHVDVDESFGSLPPVPERVFRVGLGGAPDRERFIDSLSSLGRIAVLLQRRRDRGGESLIPVQRCVLVGVIDGSGRLRFPGLGSEEDEFVDGVTTVEHFRGAASAPGALIVLDDPDT